MVPSSVREEQAGVNYVDFIERSGFDLCADVVRQVQNASFEKLAEFRDRYIELWGIFEAQTGLDKAHGGDRETLLNIAESGAGRVFFCPEKENGEFRPLIHGRVMNTGSTMLGGDIGKHFDTLDLEGRLRRIKSILLYSHRIVVSDSLLFINEFFSNRYRTPFWEPEIAKGRIRLANYLSLIAAVRPLIHDGTIVIYPQYEHYISGFYNRRALKEEEFPRWAAANLPRSSQHLAIHAHGIVNELLLMATRYNATFVADDRFKPAIDGLVRFRGSAHRTDVARDSKIAWNLASIDLPKLDSLAISDIIAIRRDAEAFADWRKLLSEAITRIDDFDGITPEAGFDEVQDMMIGGQVALSRDIQKSDTLSALNEGVKRIGISALAGLVSMGTVDPRIATATGLLTFLGQYVAGAKKRSADRALRAHLACLSGEEL